MLFSVLYLFSQLGTNAFYMFNQVQSQKQQHKILPQHIALLNLLHLDTIALEQKIQDELTENPCLEEMAQGDDGSVEKYSKDTVQDFQNWEEYGYDDIPDYKTEYENYLPTDRMPDKQLVDEVDFRDDLKRQYRFMESDEKKQALADFLIDSLNEQGFLGQDLESIAEEISFKYGTLVEATDLTDILQMIQSLDPAGVGSRDMQEFFLIQLQAQPDRDAHTDRTIELVRDHYNDLHTANLDKIRKEMKLTDEELRGLLQGLSKLKTRPVAGLQQTTRAGQTVVPDFLITMEGEDIQVSLVRQRSLSLRISQSWVESVEQADRDKSTDRSTRQYMRSKLASAQWFIKAIQERESNMLKVMRAIVDFQFDYFRFGDTMQLKPMILKNIADKVGLDISTVSRITCNKYADTPFGVVLLKDLFTEGLTNEAGDAISNKVIRTVVEEVVNKEDKRRPFTDQQLADILAGKGYRVARRTIAKYRDQLRIPVAQMRALWV